MLHRLFQVVGSYSCSKLLILYHAILTGIYRAVAFGALNKRKGDIKPTPNQKLPNASLKSDANKKEINSSQSLHPLILNLACGLVELALQPRTKDIVQELGLLTLSIAAPVGQCIDKLAALLELAQHN